MALSRSLLSDPGYPISTPSSSLFLYYSYHHTSIQLVTCFGLVLYLLGSRSKELPCSVGRITLLLSWTYSWNDLLSLFRNSSKVVLYFLMTLPSLPCLLVRLRGPAMVTCSARALKLSKTSSYRFDHTGLTPCLTDQGKFSVGVPLEPNPMTCLSSDCGVKTAPPYRFPHCPNQVPVCDPDDL
ncbi:hypothetical protein BJ138DRAFT_1156507 [Hygrophoropsis aurantiaca]|uniref:Uncharacterized protein n=1 Tax=Hygrophoropsis aurantiaca TaxID=72124 RepID=A0ACB8A775_9AGAM|nr:hypothetical protein BJ138DRAFT_1156507 [Hygrophoropsis aurantiaca]